MPYQADYVIRLIEQLSGLIRGARQRLGLAKPEEAEEFVSDRVAPEELAGEAIGLALGMDPLVASRLSPQTLAAMLELGDVNPDVLRLLVEAIELDAAAQEAGGHQAEAETRRTQAAAVRNALPTSPAQ